jgi:hypothetical protein
LKGEARREVSKEWGSFHSMEADLYILFYKEDRKWFSPLASMHANARVIIQYDIHDTEGHCTGRMSWDSSVGIVTGYLILDGVVNIVTDNGLDDREVGLRVSVGSRISSSPHRPDQFWGPPNP